jgi:hypothetical protein
MWAGDLMKDIPLSMIRMRGCDGRMKASKASLKAGVVMVFGEVEGVAKQRGRRRSYARSDEYGRSVDHHVLNPSRKQLPSTTYRIQKSDA